MIEFVIDLGHISNVAILGATIVSQQDFLARGCACIDSFQNAVRDRIHIFR